MAIRTGKSICLLVRYGDGMAVVAAACKARPKKIRFPRSIWFENRRGEKIGKCLHNYHKLKE